MKQKKFALHPGEIVSNADGQRHFISAGKLAGLYGVDITECVVIPLDSTHQRPDLINLWPRHDGNYPNLSERPAP